MIPQTNPARIAFQILKLAGDRSASAGLYVLLVALIVFLLFNLTPTLVNSETGQIQDLAYYVNLTRYFWQNSGANIYDLVVQKSALQQAFGREPTAVMPVLWAPSFVLVLLPFALLATWSFTLSHAVFMAVSVAIFFHAFRQLLPQATVKNILLAAGLLITPLVGLSLIIGQPVVLLCAWLIYRMSPRKLPLWGQVLFAGVASLKISYVPFFVLGELLYAGPRKAVGALVAVAAWWLLPSLASADNLSLAYTQALGILDSGRVPTGYAGAQAHTLMLNITFLTSEFIGYSAAFRLGLIGFAIGFCISLFSVIRLGQAPLPLRFIAIAIYVTSFLLFFPYLGWYEDVLTLGILISLLAQPAEKYSHNWVAFILLTALLFRPVVLTDLSRVVFYLIKCFGFAVCIYAKRNVRKEVEPNAQHVAAM